MKNERNLFADIGMYNKADKCDFAVDTDKITRMVNDSLNSAYEERRLYTRQKICRTILIAAVIMAVCVTGVFAAGFVIENGFSALFNASNETELYFLSSSAYDVNKKVKDENGTLEIRQVVGDENHVYILMDFTAHNGIKLNDKFNCNYHFSFYDSRAKVNERSSWTGMDFTPVYEGSDHDNKITLILGLKYNDADVRGETMDLTLKNLRTNGEVIVVPGEWKVSFPLDYSDNIPERRAETDVNIYGYDMNAKVYLSPMSLVLTFTGNVPEHPAGRWFGLDDVTINYKDGTSEPANSFSCTAKSDEDIWEHDWSFRRLVDPEKVKSITYLDCEIPLE